MTALLAVLAATPVFQSAVASIRELLIDPDSGVGHTRPSAAGSLSTWFGQQAADRAHSDTMMIPATVASIAEHVEQAVSLDHPLAHPGSSLPADALVNVLA